VTLETEHTMVVPDARMRASDAERRDCAEALKAHFAEGRLDQEEFDERLGAAMVAKTRGELAVLFADLPRAPRPPSTAGPQIRSRLPFVVAGIAFFIAFLVAALASVSTQVSRPVFNPNGQVNLRIVATSSHASAASLLVLAAIVLLVVAALARRRSPRRLDR
jgi:Domain of unknown function (DUF1707)